MFGLESQKKKKPNEEFIFELEKELKNPVKYKEILQHVEMRLQKMKEILRAGAEEIDRFVLLVHGYQSLLKVISRLTAKKK